jgi:hypothetical protein
MLKTCLLIASKFSAPDFAEPLPPLSGEQLRAARADLLDDGMPEFLLRLPEPAVELGEVA